MARFRVNGFEMHYEERGVGAPVVFVHGGFPCLATTLIAPEPAEWTWEKDLSGQFRFIAYDRRGFYPSSCPEEGYELANQAKDLEGLLDHLNTPSAHVIGSSAGGPIAMAFAATRPGRVRSLVLLGTGTNLFPVGAPIGDRIRRLILLLEREGPEAAFDRRPPGVEVSFGVLWEAEEMVERGTSEEYLARQRALAEQVARLPKQLRTLYYQVELRSIKAYMDVDVRTYARQISAPTLIMHGSNDREVPLEWGKALHRAIHSSRLDVVQGASHTLIIYHPESRRRVVEWVRQIEAEAPSADGHS